MRTEVASHIVFSHDSSTPLGQVKMAGILQDGGGVPKRRVFGYYAIVYVTRGEGTFKDDTGLSFSLKPGDLLVLFPELGHTYGPAQGKYWDETFVVFEGEVFDLWRARGLLNPEQPHYHLEPVDSWHKRIAAAVWTPTESGRDASLSRLCRFQQLLADIFAQDRQPTDGEGIWLTEASKLLQENLVQPVDYTELSAELNMSYEGFRKRFAKEAGVPPGHYLIQQRIQRACDMLIRQPVTVAEVSRELGYFDEFHFSKQFKKIVGMPPSAFSKLFGK